MEGGRKKEWTLYVYAIIIHEETSHDYECWNSHDYECWNSAWMIMSLFPLHGQERLVSWERITKLGLGVFLIDFNILLPAIIKLGR